MIPKDVLGIGQIRKKSLLALSINFSVLIFFSFRDSSPQIRELPLVLLPPLLISQTGV